MSDDALLGSLTRQGADAVSTYVDVQKEYLEPDEPRHDTRHEALQAAQDLERLTGDQPLVASEEKP